MSVHDPKISASTLQEVSQTLGFDFERLGVIVVDHGSRRDESNQALLRVVELFRQSTPYPNVEPAHMELAEPSISQAFDKLVAAGAAFIVVHPYFLLPGRHWAQDIPQLAADAAKRHPNVEHVVTAPLGIHALMATIMHDRIQQCLQHVAGNAGSCELCDDVGKCKQLHHAQTSRLTPDLRNES